MRREQVDKHAGASAPHEAVRQYLKTKRRYASNIVCVFKTAAARMGAMRIEGGEPTHAAYDGGLGGEGLERAAHDGIIATCTHEWNDATLPWITSMDEGRIEPADLAVLDNEPDVEIVERWIVGDERPQAPPPRGLGDDEELAPGARTGENGTVEIVRMIGEGRQGRRYEARLEQGDARGTWLECTAGAAGEERWLRAMRERAEIEDPQLIAVSHCGRWEGGVGALLAEPGGGPLNRVASMWSHEEAGVAILHAMTTLMRLHVRGLVHGEIDESTLRSLPEAGVELGGGALPQHWRWASPRQDRPGDNLEHCILGRASAASDIYALGVTLLAAITGHRAQPLIVEMFDRRKRTQTWEAVRSVGADAGELAARFMGTALDPYPKEGGQGSAGIVRIMKGQIEREREKEREIIHQDDWADPMGEIPSEEDAGGEEIGDMGAEVRMGDINDIADIGESDDEPIDEETRRVIENADLDEEDEEMIRAIMAGDDEGEAEFEPPHEDADDEPRAPLLTEAFGDAAQEMLAEHIGDEAAAKARGKAERAAQRKKDSEKLDTFVKEMKRAAASNTQGEEIAEALHKQAVRMSIGED